MNRIVCIVLVTLALGACKSTKIVNQDRERGELIGNETIGPAVSKRTVSLSVVGTEAKLIEELQIEEGYDRTYRVIKTVRYRDVVDASMLEPLTWPLIPVCGVIGLVTLFLVKLDCVLNLKFRNYRTERTVLPDEVDRDRKVRTKEIVRPLVDQEIDIERRGRLLTTLRTDEQGKAQFDVESIVLKANIHPKHLVHDEGIRLWAVAKAHSQTEIFRIQNSDIPTSYFQKKLTELQDELSQNEPRMKNCSRIAGNAREIFECFYQRGLIPS